MLVQGHDHVVDGRRQHVESALHFRFSGGHAVDFGVVVNEREVLALLVRVGAFVGEDSGPYHLLVIGSLRP
jgi:hypothetical protein